MRGAYVQWMLAGMLAFAVCQNEPLPLMRSFRCISVSVWVVCVDLRSGLLS